MLSSCPGCLREPSVCGGQPFVFLSFISSPVLLKFLNFYLDFNNALVFEYCVFLSPQNLSTSQLTSLIMFLFIVYFVLQIVTLHFFQITKPIIKPDHPSFQHRASDNRMCRGWRRLLPRICAHLGHHLIGIFQGVFLRLLSRHHGPLPRGHARLCWSRKVFTHLPVYDFRIPPCIRHFHRYVTRVVCVIWCNQI